MEFLNAEAMINVSRDCRGISNLFVLAIFLIYLFYLKLFSELKSNVNNIQFMHMCLSIYLFIYPTIYLSIYLSNCLTIYLIFIYPSFYISFYLYLLINVYIFFYICTCQSFFHQAFIRFFSEPRKVFFNLFFICTFRAHSASFPVINFSF